VFPVFLASGLIVAALLWALFTTGTSDLQRDPPQLDPAAR